MKSLRSAAARSLLAGILCLAMGQAARASELLETVESHYNSIFVIRNSTYVTLAFGHKRRRYVESQRNTADLLELPVAYTKAMTAALAYVDKPDDLLMIGMGGGSITWYLHNHIPDARITAVELDPEMIRLAEKYYQLKPQPNYSIVESDGRLFLVRDKKSYDVIFIDAYRGPFVPFHLLTREYYELVKKRLKPGGIVAQNVEPSTMLFDSTYATLLEVFDRVDFIPGGGNVIAVAYDGPRRDAAELMRTAGEHETAYKLRYRLAPMIERRKGHEKPGSDVQPLTDDFAPVNILKAVKVHNRKWQ
ncbi:MAG: spermidine synthase [Hyphomicrobiales bacterium]